MADLQNYIPGLGRGVTAGSVDMNPVFGQYASVTVTAAQMAALNGTAVTIIPAQGTNNAIVITDCVLDVSSGTAYTGGGTVGIYYGTGTTQLIASVNGTGSFFGTTGTTVYLTQVNSVPVLSNAAINIANLTAAFATGTETVTVNAWYAVIPVGH